MNRNNKLENAIRLLIIKAHKVNTPSKMETPLKLLKSAEELVYSESEQGSEHHLAIKWLIMQAYRLILANQSVNK